MTHLLEGKTATSEPITLHYAQPAANQTTFPSYCSLPKSLLVALACILSQGIGPFEISCNLRSSPHTRILRSTHWSLVWDADLRSSLNPPICQLWLTELLCRAQVCLPLMCCCHTAWGAWRRTAEMSFLQTIWFNSSLECFARPHCCILGLCIVQLSWLAEAHVW